MRIKGEAAVTRSVELNRDLFSRFDRSIGRCLTEFGFSRFGINVCFVITSNRVAEKGRFKRQVKK